MKKSYGKKAPDKVDVLLAGAREFRLLALIGLGLIAFVAAG